MDILKDIEERTRRIRDETEEILSELEIIRMEGAEDGRRSAQTGVFSGNGEAERGKHPAEP